ncbi:MAG: DUF934 domain-containing protein [Halioglobus sp.]
MPRLIKNGEIVNDSWIAADPNNAGASAGRICTLQQWLQLPDKEGSAVQLEPGEEPTALLDSLDLIQLVVIHFPVFTDGRGFSYGRNLREHGYRGELRASGYFLRDQLTYLRRCGFDAFRFDDDSQLEGALASMKDFTEYYQASIDQPLPLFRRRPQSTH